MARNLLRNVSELLRGFVSNISGNDELLSPLPQGGEIVQVGDYAVDKGNEALARSLGNKGKISIAKRSSGSKRPTVSPSPSPIPQSNQNAAAIFRTSKNIGNAGRPGTADFLESVVFPVTRQAGIPDAVAAGQFAAEGRMSGLGADRNNFFNLGAFDSNPNNAYSYQNPQAGVQAYADLLTGDRFAPALQNEDPVAVLRAIQQLGYAGDPRTYGRRSDSGYSSYADFIMNTPEWRYYLGQ